MKLERWICQTDSNNAEAVGHFADRLNRLGVEEKLLELGTREGDVVTARGDDAAVFDFAPQVETGVEILSWRGEGPRLESERPVVVRRRRIDAEYRARKAGEAVDKD